MEEQEEILISPNSDSENFNEEDFLDLFEDLDLEEKEDEKGEEKMKVFVQSFKPAQVLKEEACYKVIKNFMAIKADLKKLEGSKIEQLFSTLKEFKPSKVEDFSKFLLSLTLILKTADKKAVKNESKIIDSLFQKKKDLNRSLTSKDLLNPEDTFVLKFSDEKVNETFGIKYCYFAIATESGITLKDLHHYIDVTIESDGTHITKVTKVD